MRPKIVVYDPSVRYRYAHLKRDGQWITLTRVPSSLGFTAVTRRPTDISEQIAEMFAVRGFVQSHCKDQVLYCELSARGMPQSEVKTSLADGTLELLRLECFATPDLPDHVPLQNVRDYSECFGVPFVEFAQCDLVMPGWDYEAWWRSNDAEGIVFKDGNLLNWAKHKDVLTTDLVITGFKDGRGKYLGTLGALELSVLKQGEFEHVANVSGMDDATRDAISADEDSYLGKVVEVAYQYVGANGGLRHPRFVRFRDDKPAEECTEI